MVFKRAAVRKRRGEMLQALEGRLYMSTAPVSDNPLDEIGLPPVAATATTTSGTQTSAGPLSALTSIPALNSDPGAVATLYLDFHGEPSQAWGGQTVPATPAYTTDSDATTFSSQELSNIQEIWSRVSEAYSPFNVNVTTVDPGNWNLTGSGQTNHRVRVVIGGDGAWTGQMMGGIAYVGSYYQSWVPNTGYVFPVNLANGNTQYTAQDTAHEAGHMFGLQHQSSYSGTTKTAEYNTGNGSTAPFMGNPLSPGMRATWWYGQSSMGSTTMQDDLAILSGPQDAFGYRTLMYGQSMGTAAAASIASDGSFGNAGIIETTSQTDYFKFTVYSSGTDTFTMNVAQYGAMLHGQLELHDASDTPITVASAATLGQAITATLSAGTYYLVVKSYGQYGDIGQYTVTGQLQGWQAPTSATISGASNATVGSPYTLSLAGVDAGHTVIGWTIDWGDGTTPQTVTGNPSSVDHVYMTEGNCTVSATMSDDSTTGPYASNSVAVAVTLTPTNPTPPALPPSDPTPPPPQDNTQLKAQVQPVVVIGDLPAKGKRKVSGKLTSGDLSNIYEFTLTQQQVVVLKLNGSKPGLELELMDGDGNAIWTKSGKRGVTGTLTLDAGTYQLQCGYVGVKPMTFSLVEVTKPIVVKAKRRIEVRRR